LACRLDPFDRRDAARRGEAGNPLAHEGHAFAGRDAVTWVPHVVVGVAVILVVLFSQPQPASVKATARP
jgi:hypothetical protein